MMQNAGSKQPLCEPFESGNMSLALKAYCMYQRIHLTWSCLIPIGHGCEQGSEDNEAWQDW